MGITKSSAANPYKEEKIGTVGITPNGLAISGWV
jgi:hypothetical protein